MPKWSGPDVAELIERERMTIQLALRSSSMTPSTTTERAGPTPSDLAIHEGRC
jgi:hypothetical protein